MRCERVQKELDEKQAKELQQLFAEIANDQTEEEKSGSEQEELVEIDVLNLPPRSEVHVSPERRLTLNFKKPYVRFTVVILLLLVLIAIIYVVFGEQIILYFT